MLSIMWVTIFSPVLCESFVLFIYLLLSFVSRRCGKDLIAGQSNLAKIRRTSRRKTHSLNERDLLNI
jgi:hypothetical protein